jgi:hypothetical protein
MATRLILTGRAVFPTFDEPQAHPSDTNPRPKLYYSTQIMIAKGDPQIALVEAAELEAIAAKFTNGNLEKAKPIHAAAKAIGKTALHDGDSKEHESYHGNMYVSARTESTQGKPLVYGLGGKKAGPVAASTLYGGCWARFTVNFFGYGGKPGIPKGAGGGLGDTQFLRDGDAFGAGAPRASDDEFGAIDAPPETPENDPLLADG